MRNEIIKRNVLIVAVSLFIFFIASIFITSYNSRKTLEKNLLNISNVVNNQIYETKNEQELHDVVEKFIKRENWIKIDLGQKMPDI